MIDPVREAMVDLLVRLERASHDEARAFVMVTVDAETGAVIHATGPFIEAEHALVQAGKDDADWKKLADPEDGDLNYIVVPLWEPS